MGQVHHGSAMTTAVIRRATASSNEPEATRDALRDQSEDRREVEEANLDCRSADRTEGAEFDRSVGGEESRRWKLLCS